MSILETMKHGIKTSLKCFRPSQYDVEEEEPPKKMYVFTVHLRYFHF